jgi:hypothetical protein
MGAGRGGSGKLAGKSSAAPQRSAGMGMNQIRTLFVRLAAMGFIHTEPRRDLLRWQGARISTIPDFWSWFYATLNPVTNLITKAEFARL